MEKEETRVAIALGYNDKIDSAPRILASGKGQLAHRILEIAEAEKVPIVSEPILAKILSYHNPGEMIPEELYKAVAEILVYNYRKKM